jgi:hypothetical protein
MNKDTKRQCPFCEHSFPANQFVDITTCGDWWTVCGECAEKFTEKKVDKSVKKSKMSV